jgi:hypothetical protein
MLLRGAFVGGAVYGQAVLKAEKDKSFDAVQSRNLFIQFFSVSLVPTH